MYVEVADSEADEEVGNSVVFVYPHPMVAPVTPGAEAAAPAVRSAVAGLRHTAEGTGGV